MRLRPALMLLLVACGPGLHDETMATAGTTMASATSTSSLSGSSTDANLTGPTTSGASTSTSTGCSFVDCLTSGGDTDGLSECDIWEQNCPEGQKCMPWANDGSSAWNAHKCTDVMHDAGEPGDECTVVGSEVSGVDSCAKGSMCWNVSPDTGKGTCVAFCTGPQESPKCTVPMTTCTVSADAILILCVPICNPLVQDCPNMGLCIPQPNGGSFTCVLDASGDMGQQNDPCEYDSACDPGLYCANPALASECDPMVAGCCLPFCDLSDPVCTNQGAECLAWFEPGMAPMGLENVGLEVLPELPVAVPSLAVEVV